MQQSRQQSPNLPKNKVRMKRSQMQRLIRRWRTKQRKRRTPKNGKRFFLAALWSKEQ